MKVFTLTLTLYKILKGRGDINHAETVERNLLLETQLYLNLAVTEILSGTVKNAQSNY